MKFSDEWLDYCSVFSFVLQHVKLNWELKIITIIIRFS